jgi:4'-phosphopantetheinyl transferase
MGGCWTMPEGVPGLAADRLQLWRIELGDRRLLESAYAVLSPEERERAAKKREGAPRDEFVVGRGCLRRLLGTALGVELESDLRTLAIEVGAQKKPRLRAETGVTLPTFNVAHSRGMILIGLSMVGEIGADVEYLNEGIEVEDVARTAFHLDDVARIERAATREAAVAEFFRCWTRKEAVVKADGRGLTLELTSFAAGWDGESECEVILPEPVGGQSFFVRGIDVGPTHAAALAITVPGQAVCCYELGTSSPLLGVE